MTKTKIRADSHSLYIRTDGGVFRPCPTQHSMAYALRCRVVELTTFLAGSSVKVCHMGGTPLAKVTDGKTQEYWSCHGDYIGNKPGGKAYFIDSNKLWVPTKAGSA